MNAKLAECIATFFYVGKLKPAPGTWGSLAAIPLIVFVPQPVIFVLVGVLLFVVGRAAAARTAILYGKEDPSSIVIDEVVGMMITFLFVSISFWTVVAGFCLFRLFDIAKPGLVHRVEKYGNGYGIMYDDMVAGVFANIVLQVGMFGVQVIGHG